MNALDTCVWERCAPETDYWIPENQKSGRHVVGGGVPRAPAGRGSWRWVRERSQRPPWVSESVGCASMVAAVNMSSLRAGERGALQPPVARHGRPRRFPAPRCLALSWCMMAPPSRGIGSRLRVLCGRRRARPFGACTRHTEPPLTPRPVLRADGQALLNLKRTWDRIVTFTVTFSEPAEKSES